MAISGLKGARLVGGYMSGFEDGYAVIGGSACEVLMHDADLGFRTTKDVDIVLIAENRLPEVGRAVWEIVRDGGYRCGWKGSEDARFYRFTEPAHAGFPEMIELFGKAPGFLESVEGLTVAPIPLDEETSSLSAILLDEDYYSLLKDCTKNVDGVVVLDEAGLIPFKAKAHLDLAARKEKGEHVDSKDIKKHKNDVFRLAQILDPMREVELPQAIKIDMEDFCKRALDEGAPMKQLGIHATVEESVDMMRSVYGLGEWR